MEYGGHLLMRGILMILYQMVFIISGIENMANYRILSLLLQQLLLKRPIALKKVQFFMEIQFGVLKMPTNRFIMKKLFALLFVLIIYSQNVEANDLFAKNQLGAKLLELNDSERYYDFLERLSGCYVDSVIVDSKADMIGLKKGDIITKINGVVVDSHSEVANGLLKL